MNTTRLRQVRRLFANDLTPTQTQRHNMRNWVRSVRMLGNNWLIAKQVDRRSPSA